MLFVKKHDLKKQSQFSKVRIGISIYKKGDYEDFYALESTKKQSQSKPILWPCLIPKG